ncbi:hypothetical protein [Saccharothrix deserti]|nr:hypothetical protein [Saccharothrix deserti]
MSVVSAHDGSFGAMADDVVLPRLSRFLDAHLGSTPPSRTT